MKNTLTIGSNFVSECLDSVYDGNNSLFLNLIIGNNSNPKLILENGLESTTINLKSKIENLVEVSSNFIKPGNITASYKDDEGHEYLITVAVPEDTTGNMMLRNLTNLNYEVVFTKKKWDGKQLPIASKKNIGCIIVGDGLGVRDDGTIFAESNAIVEAISNLQIDSICI